MRTVKRLLKKSSDPYLALMAYRATPLANGYSPTELLMGRKIRTLVPVIPSQLNPVCADMIKLKLTEQSYRQKQRHNYDHRHRTHDMCGSKIHMRRAQWCQLQAHPGLTSLRHTGAPSEETDTTSLNP